VRLPPPLINNQRHTTDAQGEARKEFGALREDIVGCLSLVEALIDFGEGEEIEEGVFEEGACVARSLASFSLDVGMCTHLLTIYAQRGDECDV
jgi:hypothetical protein